jgi:hypothetical protein
MYLWAIYIFPESVWEYINIAYKSELDSHRNFISSAYTPYLCIVFLFSGHEPIYFIENKEKTLPASYDRGTQIFDYMD